MQNKTILLIKLAMRQYYCFNATPLVSLSWIGNGKKEDNLVGFDDNWIGFDDSLVGSNDNLVEFDDIN